jgi:predicted lipoprotein with Yx(FWY)xxD motif
MRKLAAFLAVVFLAAAAIPAVAGASTGRSRASASTPVTLTGKLKNKGIKTAKADKVSIEADDYYFSPTFVKAKAGTSLTIDLKNDGKQQHTFSVPGEPVDVTLNPSQKATVTVTVPSTGAVLFYCKLHGPTGTAGNLGMQGAVFTATKQSLVNPATATPTLKVADTQYGKILVDGNGATLYQRDNDTPTTVTCTGNCATIWPPLIPTGTPQLAPGIDAAKLTTISGPNGVQALFNGHPLYHYAQDTKPGDTNGEGVAGVWWVVGADGNKVTAAASTTTTTR